MLRPDWHPRDRFEVALMALLGITVCGCVFTLAVAILALTGRI